MVKAVKDLGFDIDTLYAIEPDAGLGNGGLGRLAAAYLDSLTSLGYIATGFSIMYDYGIFKQRIVDGEQIELPDEWLTNGSVWLQPASKTLLRCVSAALSIRNGTTANSQSIIAITTPCLPCRTI